MKKYLLILVLSICLPPALEAQSKETTVNSLKEKAQLSCKLTTPELHERKRTVISDLKNFVLDQKETKTGFKYKFEGSDRVLDLLNNFIKTERLCCDFFVFTLTTSGDSAYTWLELSGPEGTKDFIKKEIGML